MKKGIKHCIECSAGYRKPDKYSLCPECHSEKVATCLECGDEFVCHTDIVLCNKCMRLFDTDELWRAHDNNELDALDFNGDDGHAVEIRERFRR